ncbi:MAG: HD domain-containing protein [Coriobacteriaceae bacterium]|nr:HD domain-containing protein [Coriobacteriaceae bacterium]
MDLEIPDNILHVLEALDRSGYSAYVVGGCVRDALLGQTEHDWDVCTDATPDEVKHVFEDTQIIDIGTEHGTVAVRSGGDLVEVTTFRSDGAYADGRHPDQVTFESSVEDDLARRDFTVNAMAYSPVRGLVDPFGGREDLQAGRIRCVGNPDERFSEDALRIMRALRFASVLGFDIEKETAAALDRQRGQLNRIACERIREELFKMLLGNDFVAIALAYRDILAVCIPYIEKTFDFDQHNPYHAFDVWEHCVRSVAFAPADDPVMRLTLLLHDVGKPETFSVDEAGIGHCYGHAAVSADYAQEICRHLRMSREDTSRLVHLVRYHDFHDPETMKQMRRMLAKHGLERTRDLYAVHWADVQGMKPPEVPIKMEHIERARQLLAEALEEDAAFSLADLAVDGKDLKELGYPQGPLIGQALSTLLQQVVDEELPNERDALLAAARTIFTESL